MVFAVRSKKAVQYSKRIHAALDDGLTDLSFMRDVDGRNPHKLIKALESKD